MMRAIGDGRVQGDSVADPPRTDKLRNEHRAGRLVEGAGDAEHGREHQHVPVLDTIQQDQHAQRAGLQAHRQLGRHQQASVRDPVDDDAGEERQDGDRQELE
jgi:hypothetical protein